MGAPSPMVPVGMTPQRFGASTRPDRARADGPRAAPYSLPALFTKARDGNLAPMIPAVPIPPTTGGAHAGRWGRPAWQPPGLGHRPGSWHPRRRHLFGHRYDAPSTPRPRLSVRRTSARAVPGTAARCPTSGAPPSTSRTRGPVSDDSSSTSTPRTRRGSVRPEASRVLDATFQLDVDCKHLHGYDPQLTQDVVSYPRRSSPDGRGVHRVLHAARAAPGRDAAGRDLGHTGEDLQPQGDASDERSKPERHRQAGGGEGHGHQGQRGDSGPEGDLFPVFRVRVPSADGAGRPRKGQRTTASLPELQRGGHADSGSQPLPLCEQAADQDAETPDAIPEGETPHTVSMCVFDSLVDEAKPGDRVEVTGVYRAVPIRVAPNQRVLKAVYKTYVDVIHIRKDTTSRIKNTAAKDDCMDAEEAERDGTATAGDRWGARRRRRRRVRKTKAEDPRTRSSSPTSASPSSKPWARTRTYTSGWWRPSRRVYGRWRRSRRVCCASCSARRTRRSKERTPRTRFAANINVILVGDPGVSKSQLLTYVNKVAPRGDLHRVGARRRRSHRVRAREIRSRRTWCWSRGRWCYPDRGICCIDEFDKMGEGARSTLHEVMEQQTVSIAKAASSRFSTRGLPCWRRQTRGVGTTRP